MFQNDIKEKYDVCIIGGGGHIGLPLGVAFANSGVKTVLLDTNKDVLDKISSGVFPFKEEGGEDALNKVLEDNKLFCETDPSAITRSNAIITVIGTPIDEYLNPNFHGILSTMDEYFPYFNDEQILILRSTVYPGTSERLQSYFNDKGKRVRVSFCPERIVEGKALEEIKKLPQIVSAFDPQTTQTVSKLFKRITNARIVHAKPMEAELSKLFCNAWRYITFAVANQFFMSASSYDLDYHKIYEIMTVDYDRAKNIPKPGFSAGPCLLKDTMQLSAFTNNNFMLGHSAMLVNEGLPNFIIEQIKKNNGGSIKNKSIGILGMTFKAESDDIRDSLSFKLRKVALMSSDNVLCHDPFFESPEFCSLDQVLRDSDVIILGVPHNMYKHIDLYRYTNKQFVDVWNYWGRGFIFKTQEDSII